MRKLFNAVFHPEVQVPQGPKYNKTFDFVGVGRKNKGHAYRSYANDLEHAVIDICFSHRLSEAEFKLVKVF